MAKTLLCQCIVFLLVSSLSGLLGEEQACRGGVTISSESGWFSSPGFDGQTKYASNLFCVWNFKSPPGKVYQFSFKAFSVEQSTPCLYDRVIITEYDTVDNVPSSREVDTLCGYYRLPEDITATTYEIVFRFISDATSEKLGFNVTYKLIPAPCSIDRHLFKCGSEDRCINKSSICNGVEDCEDGSDEIVCYNRTDCGRRIIPRRKTSPRIKGGNVAMEGTWPWVVSLHDETGKHRCGATIFHPRWVITAAHCFPRGLQNHSVIAGRYNRTEIDRNEQIVDVESFFNLKTFNTHSKSDDIALVRLKEPFIMTDYVQSVCFPSSKMDVGDDGWVVGWGFTFEGIGGEDEPCCEDLQKEATFPVISKKLCDSADFYNGKILQHMMCAGTVDGTIDACEGDSGGPFLRQRPEDDRWELQGITSWGDGCGRKNRTGVYTVVYDYLPWIRSIVYK